MSPDKIYLGVGPLSGDNPNKKHIYAEWLEEPYPSSENIEYIRKDALLEWANNGIKRVKENSSLNSIIARGAIAAFEDLIEKLNSM